MLMSNFFYVCVLCYQQGFAQVPDLTVWYGPDSYMGANLAEMFRQMLSFSDEEIAAIHPSHTRQTISALLPRLKYFQVRTLQQHIAHN
jgi:quinolinate synthase